MKRVTSLLLIFFLLAFSFSISIGMERSTAIDFAFTGVDGKVYRLSDFRGKYVLVNLFTSYCPPCHQELRALQKLNEQCREKGVQIISLMVDPAPADTLKRIRDRYGLTYPVGIADFNIFNIFRDFSTTPATYLIDPQGKVYGKVNGYISYEEWLKLLSVNINGCRLAGK